MIVNVFDVKKKDKRKVRGNVNNHMAKWEQRDRKFRARRIRKAQRNRFREDGTSDYTQPKSFKQKKECLFIENRQLMWILQIQMKF